MRWLMSNKEQRICKQKGSLTEGQSDFWVSSLGDYENSGTTDRGTEKQGGDVSAMMTPVLDTACDGTVGCYVDYSPFAPRFISISCADPINVFLSPDLCSFCLTSCICSDLPASLIHDCNSFGQLPLRSSTSHQILRTPLPWRCC